MKRHTSLRFVLAVVTLAGVAPLAKAQRTIKADVVALDQAFYNNRLGTLQAGGMIFALREDVVANTGPNDPLKKGEVMLRPYKRARPMVLRMNVGDCMEIKFQNLLADVPSQGTNFGPPYDPANVKTKPDPDPTALSLSQPATRAAGIHVMGMELKQIQSDGSWIGANAGTPGSLVNPGDSTVYKFCTVAEGAYLLYSTGADVGMGNQSTEDPGNDFGGQLTQGLFGAVMVQPKTAEWYRSQVTRDDLDLATYRANALPPTMHLAPKMVGGNQATFTFEGKTYKLWILTGAGPLPTDVTEVDAAGNPVNQDGRLKTRDFHPIVNYQAVYPAGSRYPAGTPVLAMLNKNQEIVHTDLTAIITGPKAGLFPKNSPDPVFLPNPTYPNRDQPYREFAIHYHDDGAATQAFPQFSALSTPACQADNTCGVTFALQAARDFFAINYGMDAIGPEVWANRIKVGPMHQCDTCKFEEFFLSAWAVGDPAQIVDVPANSKAGATTGPKCTKALFPDDPSNVYHSYMGDHVQFRILHAGTNITHVHHQHAHQWLHSPNSDQSDYRDSQMISPGGAYTLDMSYFGSGNLNQTVGDSIFHCHFYPHFAQGMWSLWRVHDVFEAGTILDKDQKPVLDWNRALPDGEIPEGTPIPALVPMPTLAMAPMPVRTKLCPVWEAADYVQFTGETCPAKPAGSGNPVGFKALVSKIDITTRTEKNPGYPFFVPGIAGQRAPHPPLDFAPDEDNAGNQKVVNNVKQYLDGGLPRNQVLTDQGKIYEQHNAWDFTKENDSLVAVQLIEEGTEVETVAMGAHAVRKHPSTTPAGQAADFILNGQSPKPGAPYADPAIDIHGDPIKDSVCKAKPTMEDGCIRYKAADIQMDVVLNKKGWHFPQQRMLSLWGDVKANFDGDRRPEPLFFRANSEKVVEYWHTNLVPAYYELDDFQVRTPTDVLGQHIHLVKFDVTSSDGAGNGFNYEDGTFSPEDVVEQIAHINKNGGLFSPDATQRHMLTPKEIPFFAGVFPGKYPGAQTTIQRWYADPVYDCKKPIQAGIPPLPCKVDQDRTLRTVFTHDHFGPSTHQQVGLYAGLVIEPKDSKWFNSSDGKPLGTRDDGGPTTFQANIILPDATKSYREFLLEFQDRQLAYLNTSIFKPKPYQRYGPGQAKPNPGGPWGWADPETATRPAQAINPPSIPNDFKFLIPGGPPTPYLVTNGGEGVYSLNYSNEPLSYRLLPGADPEMSNLAHVFRSIKRADNALNVQPLKGQLINPPGPDGFKFPPPQPGAEKNDPYTPLLRAYEGDNIQIRNLVGAHTGPHAFHIHGLNWHFEPSLDSSGFRSTQGMSLSEHYELLFHLPVTSQPKHADYLYIPTSDAGGGGLQYGNWGLMRGYKEKQDYLVSLSDSQATAFPNGGKIPPAGPAPSTCPPNPKNRKFEVTAVLARDALDGPLTYNARGTVGTMGQQQIVDWNALMYVQTADLVNGKLKKTAPREPLVLRAAAGDCITLELTNALPPPATQLNSGAPAQPGFTNVTLNTSHDVGLHPQLVYYDVTTSDGVNIGDNPVTTVPPGSKRTFTWYAGNVDINPNNGTPNYTPIEFGAISLAPADPLMQDNFGLVGGLIIEPLGSTWVTDDNSRASATVTKADHTSFREAVAVVHDDLASLSTNNPIAIAGITPPQWTLNTVAQPNNSTYNIQANATVAFYSQSGSHGVTFISKQAAETYFDFGQSAIFFGPQQWCPTAGPCVATGWGTAAAAPAPGQVVLLATLTVKANIPAGTPPLQFEDTATGNQMMGSLALQSGLPATGGAETQRAINYRTEPFAYRFLNSKYLTSDPGLSPLGASRSQSNSLVAADPQTPVFVAEAGKPLRMRMLHPAGTNEQVFDLHGHTWQEEPYSKGSTQIVDNNPLSQWTGSRDAFGPNASFDVVLKHAGGSFGVQGDYLFRTFMGGDFLFGMWGLVRVGPVGKDVVTVTQYCSTPLFTITGVNTVNPSNHHMAATVKITGSGLSIPPVPVDPMTGQWIFQSTTITTMPSPITVQSAQGGTAVVTQPVCPIQNQLAVPPAQLPKTMTDELNHFKPKAPTIK